MLTFESLKHNAKFQSGENAGENMFVLLRAKIQGGWLVTMCKRNFEHMGYGWGYGGMTFVPDPNHIWDGSSLDQISK